MRLVILLTSSLLFVSQLAFAFTCKPLTNIGVNSVDSDPSVSHLVTFPTSARETVLWTLLQAKSPCADNQCAIVSSQADPYQLPYLFGVVTTDTQDLQQAVKLINTSGVFSATPNSPQSPCFAQNAKASVAYTFASAKGEVKRGLAAP